MTKYWVLCGLCCALPVAALDLLETRPANEAALAQMRRLAPDNQPLGDGRWHLYANAAEQAALQAAGIGFTRITPDIETYYAARAAREGRRAGASLGGFRTLAEIEATLQALVARYPDYAYAFVIDHSQAGRAIWALRLSDYPSQYESDEATFWLDALHHAREPLSGEVLLRFAEWLLSEAGQQDSLRQLLNSRNLLLLPCVNPDGYEYNRLTKPGGGGLWRKNRRLNEDGSYGVDLNRNYGWAWGPDWAGSDANPQSIAYHGPAAFSEPETAAVRDLLAQQPPTLSLTLHSYGAEWMFPWGYQPAPSVDDARFRQQASQFTASNGYRIASAWQLYGATNGAADDYHYGTHHSLAYTVELGGETDGFWPAPSRIQPLFEAVRPGLLAATQQAGTWISLADTQWAALSGNADNHFDSGESWQGTVKLHNTGLLAGSVGVTLKLPTTVSLLDAPGWTAEGTAWHFNLEISATSTLALPPFTLALAAQAEDAVRLSLDLAYDGGHVTLPVVLPLGSARPIALPITDMGTEWTPTDTALCATSDGTAGATHTFSLPTLQAADLTDLQLHYAYQFEALEARGYDSLLLTQVSDDQGISWQTLAQVAPSGVPAQAQLALATAAPLSVRWLLRDGGHAGASRACLHSLSFDSHSPRPVLTVWGQVAAGQTLQVQLSSTPQTPVMVYGALSADAYQAFPAVQGHLQLSGLLYPLFNGITDAQGQISWPTRLPEEPLPKVNWYLQALAINATDWALSSTVTLTPAP